MSKFYIVERRYVGPNQDQHVDSDTIDKRIKELAEEYEAAANGEGYTLDSDLTSFLEEHRAKLRDERDCSLMEEAEDIDIGQAEFSLGACYIRADMVGKLVQREAISLDDAELTRVFEGAVSEGFCIAHTQRCRALGLTLDEVKSLNEAGPGAHTFLVVTMETTSAAFEEDRYREASMIMARALDGLTASGWPRGRSFPLQDTNGSVVGHADITTLLPDRLMPGKLNDNTITLVQWLHAAANDPQLNDPRYGLQPIQIAHARAALRNAQECLRECPDDSLEDVGILIGKDTRHPEKTMTLGTERSEP